MTESGYENCKNHDEYIENSIDEILIFLSEDTRYDFKQKMDQKCMMKYCKSQFSIINVQDGNRIIIGNLTAEDIFVDTNSIK